MQAANFKQPINNTRVRPACLLIVTALVGALAACSQQKTQAAAPQTVPVVVASVEQKSVPIQLTAIGAVEAYSTVSIKPNVSGQLTGVYFKEGDYVRKGQLLFTIDKRPFVAALAQQKGNVAHDIAQAENARAQAHRYGALEQAGVIAKEQAEQMTTSAAALDAAVEADKAAVENAKVQLTYCTIYSAIEGRTGNLMVKAGNMVKANDVPILVTINQIEPIYVTFTVPEQYLQEIKQSIGRRKLAVSASLPNSTQPLGLGSLTFLDNQVDQTTGTIKLKGTFPNRERRLWPGQFVNTALTLSTRPDAIVVPSQALQTGQNGQYVFVIKPDMTAESRPVVVSQNVGSQAVIQKGLQPGERVVTDGQLRLVPGAKVEFKSPVGQPTAAGNNSSNQPGGE